MDAALRLRARRQGNVDRLVAQARVQKRIGERGLACRDAVCDLVAQTVEQGAIDLAFVGLHGPERFQKFADRPLLAERRNADRFQSGLVWCSRYGAQELLLQNVNVAHLKPLSEWLESRALTVAKTRRLRW